MKMVRISEMRRARNAGFLDRNTLGHQFYDENKEILRSLRMSFLLPNGIVGSHNTFITTTGINFSPATYLNLQTVDHFPYQKYGAKTGSNGTMLT